MNEQLQVLLDAVRRSAELAGEHAADAAWAAGKRAVVEFTGGYEELHRAVAGDGNVAEELGDVLFSAVKAAR